MPLDEVSVRRSVILENDGGKPKKRLQVLGRKRDGLWSVHLPVEAGGITVSGGEAPDLDTAIEYAAAAAARHETRTGDGEKWSPLLVIEEDDT